MKCINCGFETERDDLLYCPNCGSEFKSQESAPESYTVPEEFTMPETPPEPSAPVYTAANFFSKYLSSGLFLSVCILFTVAAALSLLGKGIPIIPILLSIFLFITYSKSKKGTLSSKEIRNLSGTVFAQYVLNWVVTGLFWFCGVIFAICSLFSAGIDLDSLLSGVESYININGIPQIDLSNATSIILLVIGIAFIIVGVVFMLLNIFGTKAIWKFLQSSYRTIDLNSAVFEKMNAAKCWLMTFGIFSGISALSTFASNQKSAIGLGCQAAALIISSVIVSKIQKGE